MNMEMGLFFIVHSKRLKHGYSKPHEVFDASMKEKIGNDIEKRLKITFSDKGYIRRLDTSDKRWIDEKIDVVTKGLLEFVSNI